MAARSELASPPGGELAPVLPIDPSQAEKGFLDTEILRHNLMTTDPVGLVTGVWRGINHVKARVLGSEPQHMPDRLSVPVNGHEHVLLVSDPDPETATGTGEAATTWFKPGLGELGDVGSALRLHAAYAEQHPERRVVTESTKGMSHTGRTVPAAELSGRRVESSAAESLEVMRRVIGESTGEIEIVGTSLGTRHEIAMAELNLAANPGDVLNITGLKLIASAAVASKIEGTENFRDPEVDEDEYRAGLDSQFRRHIPEDFARMLVDHPGDILSAWPTLAGHFIAHPNKARDRLKTMATDYANVREGTPWSSWKYVASRLPVSSVGGERDPLIREQEPQFAMLDHLYPGNVRHNTIAGLGHLMSAAAGRTVEELDRIDEQRALPFALAA
jgi:hypothetical protein